MVAHGVCDGLRTQLSHADFCGNSALVKPHPKGPKYHNTGYVGFFIFEIVVILVLGRYPLLRPGLDEDALARQVASALKDWGLQLFQQPGGFCRCLNVGWSRVLV